MRNRRLLGLALTSLLLPAGAFAAPVPQDLPADPAPPPAATPEPPKPFEASRLRQVVADLPADASAEEVERALLELLPQIYRATKRDRPVVGEVVEGLRRQPAAVEAIVRQYRNLPAEAIEKRILVLGILGEMQRPDALAHLREVAWTPLPAAASPPVEATERAIEEMVRVKAVQGLAYLGTPEADAVVREVIAKHEVRDVRIAAIDAYMWNHGDLPETAAELYPLLPADLHPYVDRPRYHKGMDRVEFSQRLRAWQAQWENQPPPAPAPAPSTDGSAS